MNKELLFLKSAVTESNPFIRTSEIPQWLEDRRKATTVRVKTIPFSQLDQWYEEEGTGNIRHRSGKFFSIEGLHVSTNWGAVSEWCQPIINQPEIGILGIIAKEIDGVLYFLMQAKIEPGNAVPVQLSPTLQATRSNYQQAHKGKRPLYLDYFLDRQSNSVLVDQLQSEQGARFWRKRNRNIIVLVNDDVPVGDDFCWLTLAQIKSLLAHDNMINMDTRTVVSGLPFGDYQSEVSDFSSVHFDGNSFGRGMLESTLSHDGSVASLDDILSWFSHTKSQYDLHATRIPLCNASGWDRTDYGWHHETDKFFRVVLAQVEISNREVRRWTQPLLQPVQQGLIAFITKRIHGRYHFLVQAKVECGDLDVLELAPTVQCLTGNYRDTKKGSLPFLEYVLAARQSQIRYSALLSEEGGRFFCEQNRNLVVEADDAFEESLPANYHWMTLRQLNFFLKFNNYLNIQARSLLSTIRFIGENE
jgi:oxidase EvaA